MISRSTSARGRRTFFQRKTATNTETTTGKPNGSKKYFRLSNRLRPTYLRPKAEETSPARLSTGATDISHTTCSISARTSAAASIFHFSEIFGNYRTKGLNASSSSWYLAANANPVVACGPFLVYNPQI